MTFTLIVRRLCRSQLPEDVDFPHPHPLLPQQHQTSLGHIGIGLRDPTAPSAIMWTPIYGRLGDRRLGTVIFCISFVDWPSQGSLEHSFWISLGYASVVYYIYHHLYIYFGFPLARLKWSSLLTALPEILVVCNSFFLIRNSMWVSPEDSVSPTQCIKWTDTDYICLWDLPDSLICNFE
jgi:hypothetical protein